jgi:Mor family transcriptional regulator
MSESSIELKVKNFARKLAKNKHYPVTHTVGEFGNKVIGAKLLLRKDLKYSQLLELYNASFTKPKTKSKFAYIAVKEWMDSLYVVAHTLPKPEISDSDEILNNALTKWFEGATLIEFANHYEMSEAYIREIKKARNNGTDFKHNIMLGSDADYIKFKKNPNKKDSLIAYCDKEEITTKHGKYKLIRKQSNIQGVKHRLVIVDCETDEDYLVFNRYENKDAIYSFLNFLNSNG